MTAYPAGHGRRCRCPGRADLRLGSRVRTGSLAHGGPVVAARQRRHRPAMPAYQYLLTRPGNGHLAALPLHVVHAAATPDADPRSYFGGTLEANAGQVCCGSQQASPAAQVLTGLDAADVFPALVLGSLPWVQDRDPALLLDARARRRASRRRVGYARAQGIATIVAPWVADRGSGKALARELRHRGAVASFWAVEDYLPLRHGSLEAHVAAMRPADRYRYREDIGAAGALGLDGPHPHHHRTARPPGSHRHAGGGHPAPLRPGRRRHRSPASPGPAAGTRRPSGDCRRIPG